MCITDDVLAILPTLAEVVAKLSEEARGARLVDVNGDFDWLTSIATEEDPRGALFESFELDDVVPPAEGDSESLVRTFSNMEDNNPRLTSVAAVTDSIGFLCLFQPKIFVSPFELICPWVEYSKGGSAKGKSAVRDC